LSKQHSMYRKKNHLVRQPIDFPTARRLERTVEERKKKPSEPAQSVRAVVEKVLVEERTPLCVVVNRSGEILHFHGRTGKYLEQPSGEPTTHVTDMAREGLRFALLSALRRVSEENPEIREKALRVKINHDYQRIDLVVKRISEPPLRDCRLVLFEERPEPPAGPEQLPVRDQSGEEGIRRVAELEEDLLRVRQDYRSAMEELQTSNEELRSTNEEIHSSNEELQSTNEELNTVNSELNNKIVEVNTAYNAISSVLNHTRIAIVFLDRELCLKRFTPEATGYSRRPSSAIRWNNWVAFV
jgi:two-component system CheB/CheR fusion protein